ncbi:SDR family NAD(P)-dependent oxidoreductase [Streptomyces sp. NPDC049627]|uniref:SDR family NAD(P)-dependent oxidoreductase n=1 Tax=Streptomyces sp. NPDC049627 TaxID=3365595 RepID=UPI003794A5D5
MRTAAPSLRRDDGGVIVNISSIAGITGYAGIGAYGASKWGLRGLTKAAALELAPDRIRVCSIHPGAVRTAMTADFDDSFTAGQPLPRPRARAAPALRSGRMAHVPSAVKELAGSRGGSKPDPRGRGPWARVSHRSSGSGSRSCCSRRWE